MVHDIILANLNQGGFWFLDAPGGTGKTFLTKLILANVRKNGHKALAVASSGIAATLLPGGRTAHSTFKLPWTWPQMTCQPAMLQEMVQLQH